MDLANAPAFSSFSTNDVAAARKFYEGTLGLKVTNEMGALGLAFPSGVKVFIYPKNTHQPATFTVLNLPVKDLKETVNSLSERGVKFLRYEGFKQDEKGIAWSDGEGPSIAWFADPAGNIISVLSES